MLGSVKGSKLDTFVSDYVVFDLETTGISPYSDKVVEISAVKVKDGEVVDEFTSLVNPECHISEDASAVNGIYDYMVADEPTFEEVLPKFIEFIEELPLMGHNIQAFDLTFIYRDCKEILGAVPDNDYIDTVLIARKCMPEMAHRRLTDLATHFGISIEGAHRALKDSRMTQQVYEHLKDEMVLFESGQKKIPICGRCGKQMKLRNGKFGEFWGCSGYPECNYTMNI